MFWIPETYRSYPFGKLFVTIKLDYIRHGLTKPFVFLNFIEMLS